MVEVCTVSFLYLQANCVRPSELIHVIIVYLIIYVYAFDIYHGLSVYSICLVDMDDERESVMMSAEEQKENDLQV